MSGAMGVSKKHHVCQHSKIQVDVSSHASEVNFKRVPPERRVAATTPSGRVVTSKSNNDNDPSSQNRAPSPYSFPAPLILPGDSLSIDPKEPPQSLRSFIQEGARNPLTNRRKTLYVGRVAVESGDPSSFSQLIKSWSVPLRRTPHAGRRISKPSTLTSSKAASGSSNAGDPALGIESPKTEDIIEYLSAYYHPLEVKPLDHEESCSPARFIPWEDFNETFVEPKLSKPKSRRKGAKIKAVVPDMKSPSYIGLQLGEGVTRVRTRPCPDDAFPRQVNLNDLMDGLLEAIPPDAHSAILLVDQDMYDDDEDTIFCCGLAYGGSRVAVVSTARYHPVLDSSHSEVPTDTPGATPVSDNHKLHGKWSSSLDHGIEYRVEVDREHMWPGSHCSHFVESMLGCKDGNLPVEEDGPPKRKRTKKNHGSDETTSSGISLVEIENTPIGAAIKASSQAACLDSDLLSGVWFSRVARTTAHELGHCFCLGHCVYYACSMQGTSCLAEDLRQPPYLCPVCLAKLTRAVLDVEKSGGMDDGREFVLRRYRALLRFCSKTNLRGVGMFAGFRGWLEKRIEEVEAEGE